MKQERYNNQSKIFGEITASKFQEQHTPQFSVCRYEDLCPAAKTELHRWCFQPNFAKVEKKRKQSWRRAHSDSCGFRFSLFPGQLLISHEATFLHKFLHSRVPWLITTSCLISQFQISGRKSETLGRGFKLSAEDLDIRPRV